MKLRSALLTATLLAAPAVAMAQPVDGLYIGAGVGYDYKFDTKIKRAQPDFGSTVGSPVGQKFRGDGGFIGDASVGYGLGNGLRVELQGDYKFNHQRLRGTRGGDTNAANGTFQGGANLQNYGAFVNALFDFDIGSDTFFPYVGLGAGYEFTSAQKGSVYLPGAAPQAGYTLNTNSYGSFAAQGIVGVGIALTGIPGLSLTTEARFTALPESVKLRGTQNISATGGRASLKLDNQYDVAALIGLRYAFNTPEPAPAPTPVAPPQADITRSYLVFFDWDRADLTSRARQIISEAAANAAKVHVTRIDVSGHADASGTAAYNQRLSLRRADNVAAELVRLGVARSEISVMAFGDTHLLVPTAPGVREPQNRRVEIVLH